MRLHARHLRERFIRLGCIAYLELHQQAAQISLVARESAVEQERALGAVELQQTRECIDVFLNQGAVLLECKVEPIARHREHREQIFG